MILVNQLFGLGFLQYSHGVVRCRMTYQYYNAITYSLQVILWTIKIFCRFLAVFIINIPSCFYLHLVHSPYFPCVTVSCVELLFDIHKVVDLKRIFIIWNREILWQEWYLSNLHQHCYRSDIRSSIFRWALSEIPFIRDLWL